ncbi:Cytochrome c subfamily protein [beta proteobacterium KB13]|uniref:Cytochrome c subfamily protein n=1 Tax=beta proteobacterium KB13 TaxID=314607 RepID=B6BTG1_9PROT|nr:Cytochrome c subfamily protein [beta proteobacterium KB13]
MIIHKFFVSKFTIVLFPIIFSCISNAADPLVGEKKFKEKNCVSCHGPKGMGMASYPRIGGKEVDYLTKRLETYRAGERIGANSDLMIMNAKKLTDEDIADLTAYLSEQSFD